MDYTPHTVTATAFSHRSSLAKQATNDLRLAVGRSNGDIEIWNPKYNWTHELTLSGARGRTVEGLCWAAGDSEEPARLFSIGGSTYITEWDLSTGKPVTNYDCNAGIIWSMAINASENKLAVGCDDGSVVIVDISGGLGSLEHDMICQRQDARVLSIKWYNDEILVGGCADGRIREWSANGETKGRILATMRVDKSKTESTLVWAISILPNKKQIVSGDSTGSVKFWDLEHFSLLQSFKVHDADVLSIVSDASEEKIFSAGVDRKIHQFNLITTKSSTSKWVHNSNRLLHSNDIRSMSIFESKAYNFLISGGVERSIVIQSVQHFQDGKYKKLLINQQKPNVVVNMAHKLIALWQDQSIKLWKVQDSTRHKLVSVIKLSDDDNITSIDINSRADLLIVSTLNSVKAFRLTEDVGKLKITKFRDEDFDSLIEGAKSVKFFGEEKFLILTPGEEIYKFVINTEDNTITLDDEIEILESKKGRLQYSGCINNWEVSPNKEKLIVSRFNGSIEAYPLNTEEDAYLVTKLSSYPHLLHFSSNDKIVVLTEDNKLYEFLVATKNSTNTNNLLTPWSKRNSEFLPHQFLNLDDKPQGVFTKGSRVWIYGSTWLSFFDLSVNIPINKVYKNTSNSKKRNRDGLTINEDVGETEVDGDLDIVDQTNADILGLSLKQSHIDRMRQQIQDTESNGNSDESKKPFWLTTKYRPIMKVEDFGEEEIVVIERPQFALPTTTAFSLPKLRI